MVCVHLCVCVHAGMHVEDRGQPRAAPSGTGSTPFEASELQLWESQWAPPRPSQPFTNLAFLRPGTFSIVHEASSCSFWFSGVLSRLGKDVVFLKLKLCLLFSFSVFFGSASEIYWCIGGFPGEFQFQLRITHEVRPALSQQLLQILPPSPI